ncbi:NADH-quinone oxidoreductase subunit J [Gemmata sp. JC717]|uniref:NADH-quinone oxidoreductase subunit J family protein n=1 Tax=Gemmata algarum TaxID=2975278 RepID=UPI0021BB3407|nr:NADH-quinone oxidoreductase subunit J [Gemmata algarum]MDY3554136.1 NADH-quinone oxidoreductase subunit J [Gemmata algarum]
MNLLALSSTQQTGGQLALAALLGVVGFYLLLPRPRGRFVPGGIAALVGSAAVLAAWLVTTFGAPMPDIIGTALFYLFSAGALVFGTVLVVQKNPARGAIAFAFVILSVCGLFLLLAAPFLMAATVIIYAGAIIVTFLFVLMLSQAGASNENDRTREPLYGSFAGFAFVGLVLFALYQTSQGPKAGGDGTAPPAGLPAQVVTAEERRALGEAAAGLEQAEKIFDGDLSTATERDKRTEEFERAYRSIKNDALVPVVGGVSIGAGVPARSAAVADEVGQVKDGSIRERLEPPAGRLGGTGTALVREDPQAREVLKRAAAVRKTSAGTLGEVERLMSAGGPPDARDEGRSPTRDGAKAAVRKLREEVLLLRGSGDLPAGNVRNLGFVLYSQHLLAVELAGTLLLVAVIGAVAITHRKGGAQ